MPRVSTFRGVVLGGDALSYDSRYKAIFLQARQQQCCEQHQRLSRQAHLSGAPATLAAYLKMKLGFFLGTFASSSGIPTKSYKTLAKGQ